MGTSLFQQKDNEQTGLICNKMVSSPVQKHTPNERVIHQIWIIRGTSGYKEKKFGPPQTSLQASEARPNEGSHTDAKVFLSLFSSALRSKFVKKEGEK